MPSSLFELNATLFTCLHKQSPYAYSPVLDIRKAGWSSPLVGLQILFLMLSKLSFSSILPGCYTRRPLAPSSLSDTRRTCFVDCLDRRTDLDYQSVFEYDLLRSPASIDSPSRTRSIAALVAAAPCASPTIASCDTSIATCYRVDQPPACPQPFDAPRIVRQPRQYGCI